MASLPRTFLTPEEYLAIERRAEFKSEYSQGQMFAMAGGTPVHSQIASNVTRLLGNLLDASPCIVYTSDLRVIASEYEYCYPDLTVVCGTPKFISDESDVLANPVCIVEVLSPKTEAYDRGAKFAKYRRIESLRHYVLIAQDRVQVECYTLRANGQWLYVSAESLDSSVSLTVLGVELPLAEVYRKVRFDDTPTPASN